MKDTSEIVRQMMFLELCGWNDYSLQLLKEKKTTATIITGDKAVRLLWAIGNLSIVLVEKQADVFYSNSLNVVVDICPILS